MHNLRFLLPFIVVFASCGSDTTTTTTNLVDTTSDTVAVVDTIPIDTIPQPGIATTLGGDTIVTSDKSQIFFSFNQKLFDKNGKALSAKEVKRRFLPLDPECDGEIEYKLKRFFALDSLKKLGEEPEHDMGQIMWAEVKMIDTIRKDSNGCWVIWRLSYETEQACPYASGALVMITTYDAKGKQVSTQCMSRDEGGADAPISWSCHEYSNIFKDGSFRGLYADSTEDYDENDKPVYSVMRKTFTGQISAAGKITRTELEIERSE
jgi:hypothetical protein